MLHPDPTQRPSATSLKILANIYQGKSLSQPDLVISRLNERITQLEKENEILRAMNRGA